MNSLEAEKLIAKHKFEHYNLHCSCSCGWGTTLLDYDKQWPAWAGHIADELEQALARESAPTLVGDNDIFMLACKLIDTAGSDRKTYWLPALSQLCEAVRRQDAELAASRESAAPVLSSEVKFLLQRVEEDARGTRCLTMAEVTLCLKALKLLAESLGAASAAKDA